MAREKAITDAICRRLREAGLWHVKLHGSPMQRRGLPDLLIIVDGRAVFLEVKRPGLGATRLQGHRIAELREAGAVAGVVHSWDETLGLLRPARKEGA